VAQKGTKSTKIENRKTEQNWSAGVYFVLFVAWLLRAGCGVLPSSLVRLFCTATLMRWEAGVSTGIWKRAVIAFLEGVVSVFRPGS
jgi:hypothetical protein